MDELKWEQNIQLDVVYGQQFGWCHKKKVSRPEVEILAASTPINTTFKLMDGGQLVEKLIFSKDVVKLQQRFNQVSNYQF